MRFRLVALPVALALLQTGCNGLLTEAPRSAIVEESFYKTEADANAAITAAYAPVATSFAGGMYQWGMNALSDQARIGQEEENPTHTALGRALLDSQNTHVATGWSNAYTVITRSNVVLEKVPEIVMNDASKGRILGEAKFLRALFYFYLVRWYGDVPLVRTREEQLAPGARAPKAEVYAQIIKDAEEAEAALPATRIAAERGRATKGSAQALQAELYLWRSSRENSNEWAKARDAAKKIIDSGVYRLEPNYLNAFLPGTQNRTEEVFAAQSSSATGGSSIGIVQWVYPRALDSNGAGGFGTWQPLQWFIDSYTPGDYRKDVTFFTTGKNTAGKDVTFLPHVYKYRPTARPGREDENYPVYRYADVLLMYAEALNELGAPDQAIQFVNQVRARARNGTGSENRAQPANLPVMSQNATRDALFQEREWELSFESKRWFDQVRRGEAYFLATQKRDLQAAPNIDPTDMYLPIPRTQIDVNPLLTQNPGF
jgi:hypothetical protein